IDVSIDKEHTATSISEESHDYAWDIAKMGEELPLRYSQIAFVSPMTGSWTTLRLRTASAVRCSIASIRLTRLASFMATQAWLSAARRITFGPRHPSPRTCSANS